MPLTAGDKCPQCREGLLEKSKGGLKCTNCDFDMEIAEVVAANQRERTHVGEYKFKGANLKIAITDPDDAEEFLRGLILARQNNNSVYFVELIDGVNQLLEPWRAERLRAEMERRGN